MPPNQTTFLAMPPMGQTVKLRETCQSMGRVEFSREYILFAICNRNSRKCPIDTASSLGNILSSAQRAKAHFA
jgi:hypothetical protein